MKSIFNKVCSYFRTPSLAEARSNMLEQARWDAVRYQAMVDYNQAMVDYNKKVIERMTTGV